jgi:hypothetical protein
VIDKLIHDNLYLDLMKDKATMFGSVIEKDSKEFVSKMQSYNEEDNYDYKYVFEFVRITTRLGILFNKAIKYIPGVLIHNELELKKIYNAVYDALNKNMPALSILSAKTINYILFFLISGIKNDVKDASGKRSVIIMNMLFLMLEHFKRDNYYIPLEEFFQYMSTFRQCISMFEPIHEALKAWGIINKIFETFYKFYFNKLTPLQKVTYHLEKNFMFGGSELKGPESDQIIALIDSIDVTKYEDDYDQSILNIGYALSDFSIESQIKKKHKHLIKKCSNLIKECKTISRNDHFTERKFNLITRHRLK